MADFKINQAAIDELAAKLTKVIEEKISDVSVDMKGQPAHLVEDEISRRIRAAGVTYTPGADLHAIAEKIEAGDY